LFLLLPMMRTVPITRLFTMLRPCMCTTDSATISHCIAAIMALDTIVTTTTGEEDISTLSAPGAADREEGCYNDRKEKLMKLFSFRMHLALVFMLIGILAAGPVLAEKPPWAGGGKGEKQKPQAARERHEGKRYFTEQQRAYINDYYAKQYGRKGHCPPGLAKKQNGCMPPGQAKKWRIGQPLPRDVVFYNLPPNILGQLGPPPSRHRFVRVAQDILLIATGTGMVVDAIDNLNWEFSR